MLFFFQDGFSQEYRFDTLYEYNSCSFYLVNSKDNSYYLNSSKGSKTVYGTVRDSKEKTIHEYELVNHDDSIEFNYLYSVNVNLYPHGYGFVVESSEKKIDSTKREVNIIIYRNKRKKMIECEMTLLIENSDNLFPNQLLNAFCHGKLANTNFKIDKGTLLSFNSKVPGHIVEGTLTKKQQINTLLSISKEQMKYKE